jgi:type I site-specific restriction-modification system R (restriction) subunit
VDGRITDSILINLGEKAFTLFELFNAIFYEISYHGGPQDKKERFSEIEESMEEVKDNLDDLKESSDKFTTFEEMIEKFDAKDKYLVKYNELRDRVEKKRVSNKKNLPKLKNCLLEKLKIYDQIEKSDIDNLIIYYKKLTDIEFNMQLLYGEEEDISYHRFWETPKCTCPKIDNLEIFPFNNPIFDSNCPIHKK